MKVVSSHDDTLLPWYVKQTIFDMYPEVYRHMDESCNRFLNINQVIVEMLKIARYHEYIYLFPQLKSKKCRDKIEKTVKDALGLPISLGIKLPRLDELPMFSHLTEPYRDPKCYPICHIYSEEPQI